MKKKKEEERLTPKCSCKTVVFFHGSERAEPFLLLRRHSMLSNVAHIKKKRISKIEYQVLTPMLRSVRLCFGFENIE